MLENNKLFNQLRRQISLILLTALVWFISLPTSASQAAGYYSDKSHNVEISQPYYITKERRILVQKEPAKPYYSTKDRKKEKVIIKTPEAENNYIESGKRPGAMMPKDSEAGIRQKK
ncbi:MAG: hypothetical protein AB3A66_07170 [Nodularia sp. CChRGM 3473]